MTPEDEDAVDECDYVDTDFEPEAYSIPPDPDGEE